MKITTKKQLLLLIITVNLLVFSVIGAVLYYFDGVRSLVPVFSTAAALIAIQYNMRKKQLLEA
ncbi:MAG: hypothetical protein DI539_14480 [Flavobacterium psychrophilum]|nr:MAG: hypothetical protein DI539_14480 [Flavobacterium psychrophilum]